MKFNSLGTIWPAILVYSFFISYPRSITLTTASVGSGGGGLIHKKRIFYFNLQQKDFKVWGCPNIRAIFCQHNKWWHKKYFFYVATSSLLIAVNFSYRSQDYKTILSFGNERFVQYRNGLKMECTKMLLETLLNNGMEILQWH